jgi:hypothetical protein
MDPTERRDQPAAEAREADDYAPTAEFRAFLAGDPVAKDDEEDARPAGTGGWLARLRSMLQRRR